MSYDHALAERIRRRIGDRPDLIETQMFGGLAFLIHGRMSVGVVGNDQNDLLRPQPLAATRGRLRHLSRRADGLGVTA